MPKMLTRHAICGAVPRPDVRFEADNHLLGGLTLENWGRPQKELMAWKVHKETPGRSVALPALSFSGPFSRLRGVFR